MSYSKNTSSTETEVDLPKANSKTAKWWIDQIATAEAEAESFRESGEEAYKEYEFQEAQGKSYNWKKSQTQHIALYWSSIQTLGPSVYSQTPIPMIKRRFDDKDHVGRVASMIGERFLRTLVSDSPFDEVMDRITQDYLIPGFGLPRVRYVKKSERKSRVYITNQEELPQDKEVKVIQDENGYYYEDVLFPESSSIEPEWVPWDSYIFTPGARTEQQIWWKGYIDFFDKETFKARFIDNPDIENPIDITKVNFKYNSRHSKNDENDTESHEADVKGEFVKVVEIWDERDYCVKWVCPDYTEDFLDKADDIYQLRKFFPSPCPIMASVGNKNLYPIPEFIQTKHILVNIDFLANRKNRLVKALRPRGVFDQDIPQIKRLAREAEDADMIPVENWMSLVEKGGLNAVMQWADNSAIAEALLQTYDAFSREKELYYEITGNSDIMRGAVAASESATATATKDKFVGIRQSKRSKDIQRIARDLIELMADLAFHELDDQTILAMADAQFIAEEDQQYIPQALALLRQDQFRTFRILIETDSTIAVNSDIEKALRLELLDAISSFIEKLANVINVIPETAPLMMDTILYAVRGLKQSATLESSIEAAFDAIKTSQEQAAQQEPPPDPRMIELEMKQELENLKLQIEKSKQDMEAEQAITEADIEREKLQLERDKLALEREKLEFEAEKEITNANREDEKLDLERQVKSVASLR